MMADVVRRYDGDYAVPVPSDLLDDLDERPKVTPALLAEAIDMPAMRAASVTPELFSPALDDSKDTGVRSKEYARTRRRALAATYHMSKWPLIERRMYRHLAGYAWSAVGVIPDAETKMPKVVMRDPLSAYPDPRAPEDLDLPRNVGFIHTMSATKLVDLYPEARREGPIDPSVPNWDTELWDLLEWIDDRNVYVGIVGRHESWMDTATTAGNWPDARLLRSARNETADGIVPWVVPQTITLDKIVSRLNQMVGKVDAMTYLLDLNQLATQKAIFPDLFALGDNGPNPPRIVSNDGQWMDGRSGEINLLDGVNQVGALRTTPDQSGQFLARELERFARIESGLTGPAMGETAGMSGMLRTGRGIDQLTATAVDPRIHELHDIASYTMMALNRAIFAVYEGHYAQRKFVLFSGWPGERGHVEFRPATHIETRDTLVTFPFPGSDSFGQTVQIGQMVQAGLMSRETARRRHPYIEDAEAERRLAVEEDLDDIVLASLRQRAVSGMTPLDTARIRQLVREGLLLDDAIRKAEEEARLREAQEAAAPQGSPATQPGLGLPGESFVPASPAAGPPQPRLSPESVLGALMGPPSGTPNIPPQTVGGPSAP